MTIDRSQIEAGPASREKMVRGRVRPAIVLGTVLAAALALGPAARAGVLAQEAGKAGAGVTAVLNKRAEARSGRDAARPAPGPILIEMRSEFTVADVVGQASDPLPLDINVPPHKPTDYMLLSFRGLPKNFALSSGFRAAEAWLVSAHEAENLRLIAPKDYVGTFKLEVQLLRGQNADPLIETVKIELRRQTRVKRAEPVTEAPATAASAKTEPRVSPAKTMETAAMPETPPEVGQTPRSVRVAPDKEQRLLEAASGLLAQNDITAARLIYARLAREGSLQGALTMAQTFDPAFLATYQINGLQPDREKAKYWYGVAASLGSKDAPGRLLALEAASGR